MNILNYNKVYLRRLRKVTRVQFCADRSLCQSLILVIPSHFFSFSKTQTSKWQLKMFD